MCKETNLAATCSRFITHLSTIPKTILPLQKHAFLNTWRDATNIRTRYEQRDTYLHEGTCLTKKPFISIFFDRFYFSFHMRTFNSHICVQSWVSASSLFPGMSKRALRPIMRVMPRTRHYLKRLPSSTMIHEARQVWSSVLKTHFETIHAEVIRRVERVGFDGNIPFLFSRHDYVAFVLTNI